MTAGGSPGGRAPPRLLVLQGPGADPTRRGMLLDAPGSPEVLDARCRDWGRALGAEVTTVWAPHEQDMAAALGGSGCDGLVLAAGDAAFASEALAEALAAAGVPAVDLHLRDLRRRGLDPRESRLAKAGARVLHGRGLDGYRDALRHVAAELAHPPEVRRYGPGPDHLGDLRVPAGSGPHPVVVLAHGGFWLDPWERDLMDGLAAELPREGWATWNVEYRRVGSGGGWPHTAEDVAAAVDHVAALAARAALDLDRVALVGHSAGGHLALLAAGRADAAVRPVVVAVLAGLCDLAAAHEAGLGGAAVAALLGSVDDERVAEASPIARLPLGVPTVLAHGTGDPIVPVAQSRSYAAAARRRGDEVALLEVHDVDHFAFLDPRSVAWHAVAGAIKDALHFDGSAHRGRA